MPAHLRRDVLVLAVELQPRGEGRARLVHHVDVEHLAVAELRDVA